MGDQKVTHSSEVYVPRANTAATARTPSLRMVRAIEL